MNLLLLIGFGAGSLLGLWGVQSMLLLFKGEPLAGPLRVKDREAGVRWPMKIALQLVLLSVLVGYPMAIGQNGLRYHQERLLPVQAGRLLEAALAILACFVIGTTIEVAAGWVRFQRRYSWKKNFRKLGGAVLTPLPLAFIEEAIFRGIVLEALLQNFPGNGSGQAAALILSSAVFAAVHFIRPARTYGPALGLFGLGCLLGTAYLIGGHTYWLPVGLHAGGILATQLLRPFVEYRGPPWVIGYRSYPVGGLIGLSAMGLLALYIAARFL
jgi:hypothetical protein